MIALPNLCFGEMLLDGGKARGGFDSKPTHPLWWERGIWGVSGTLCVVVVSRALSLG